MCRYHPAGLAPIGMVPPHSVDPSTLGRNIPIRHSPPPSNVTISSKPHGEKDVGLMSPVKGPFSRKGSAPNHWIVDGMQGGRAQYFGGMAFGRLGTNSLHEAIVPIRNETSSDEGRCCEGSPNEIRTELPTSQSWFVDIQRSLVHFSSAPHRYPA